MSWLADYWWVILLILIGMIWNGIKALMRVNPKRYLDDRPPLPPHRDNNAQWDDDDWPRQEKDKGQDKAPRK
ncbi:MULTISPECIES: YpfN family protein [Edwardsiella]|uniref:Uncharacterized protein n=2 Tax=Edwardsiella anguillarum TaxID=1821960 RepID=A0A076LNK8_9GAMM|nr:MULTISPECIES: YpfN family protein [Edwardsiella]AKM48380.1 hypothetical protein QY76_14735 [Edwardsiella sp. EA181011]GAJ66386.1 hypothetical protein MA13_contig00002-0080 [Edwardsiella piscicida]AIJ09476.1 Hypothetical protein ETEE_3047 [Edwardsiella anguillarum ET080813]AKR77269.1 YpfN family protein [Edwardsiella sp. LADL05-105]KAB0590501.1 YpfN family protein [Edwardsiella anguillarum]